MALGCAFGPILMTSFAFILGCVPLWISTGAGAVARQIMGTTAIGGMLAASIIGISLFRRCSVSLSDARLPLRDTVWCCRHRSLHRRREIES
jgi:Cu/Ag efflux pump CusA